LPILATIILLAIALLAFPAGASAKFTCEDRGARPRGLDLRGLPATPVAGRAYALSVTLRTPDAANASPYLGAEPCDGRPEGMPGAGGWFLPVPSEIDLYVLSLRFPHPGSWALSFMDLDGTFYDLGLRRVGAVGARAPVAVGAGLGLAAAVERLLSAFRAAAQRP
jgi:hypothetical protein